MNRSNSCLITVRVHLMQVVSKAANMAHYEQTFGRAQSGATSVSAPQDRLLQKLR